MIAFHGTFRRRRGLLASFKIFFFYRFPEDEERPKSKCGLEEEGFCRRLKAMGIRIAPTVVLSSSNMISLERSSLASGLGFYVVTNFEGSSESLVESGTSLSIVTIF